jgi:peptide/nickel transport system substrate-binding protein
MQRLIVCWALLGLLVGLVSSPVAQAQPALPVELHEGLVGQINKLNPLFAEYNPVDEDLTSLIYEGLTSINQYGEVVPRLAERWVVSSDGLDYVFYLRRDVLWQDGLPFTSADVAYTFRTIRSRDFPGDPLLRDFWRTVEIQVLDDYTLRFRLVQPLASFPERLRQGILPLHALDGAPIASLDTHPFNLSPIGTGPYQIETLLAEGGQITGISLRVAPNFRLRPEGQQGYALDRIVFRTYPTWAAALEAYQNGQINSLGVAPLDQLEALRAIPNLAQHTTTAPRMGALIFNYQRDDLHYLRDARFRQALELTTDRTGSILRALGGRAVPASSPILPTSWAYNPSAIALDPNLDEARRLFGLVSFEPYQPPTPESQSEEATQEAPAPVEQRRNLRVMVFNDPGVAGVAFEVVNQWANLLPVELDLVEDYATYLSRLQNGDFDVALVEFSFAPKADPDPFVFWHTAQYQIGQNFGGMPDNFLSNLLLQARTTPDNLLRKQFYDEFQLSFLNTVAGIVLYNPLFVYVTDRQLQGVQLDFISTPSDRFRTIHQWRFGP